MKLTKRIIDVDNHIANMIKKYRINSGYSQKELAQKAGISSQQVQKYESMKSKINAAKLYEFALILEIPLYNFFESENSLKKYKWLYFPKRIGKKFVDIGQQEFLQLVANFSRIDSYVIRKSILNVVENLAIKSCNK